MLKSLTPDHPFSDEEKAELCSTLKQVVSDSQASDTQSTFFLYDSITYICPALLSQAEGLQHFKEDITSAKSVYYKQKIALLSRKAAKNLEKADLSKLTTRTVTEKMYAFMLRCGQEKGKACMPYLQGAIKMIISQKKISLTEQAIVDATFYLGALLECGRFTALNESDIEIYFTFLEEEFRFSASHFQAAVFVLSRFDSVISPVLNYPKHFLNNGEQSVVRVFVSNRFTLEQIPRKVSATLESATCDSKRVLNNQVHLSQNGGSLELAFDSSYRQCSFVLDFSASSAKVVNHRQEISISSPDTFKLVDVDISVRDSNTAATAKQVPVEYGSNVGSLISGRLLKMSLQFYVTLSNTRVEPEQIFLVLRHTLGGPIATFPATRNSNKRFICEFDVYLTANNSFFYTSGEYTMELIVGGTLSPSVLVWDMGTVKVFFSTPSNYPLKKQTLLPELHNYPTKLYKEPLRVFSLIFSCLILICVMVFFYLVWKTGFRISLKFSLWRLVFYVAFLGLFYVCFCYWRYMNGFEAFKYYAPLSVIVCLSLGYMMDINTAI